MKSALVLLLLASPLTAAPPKDYYQSAMGLRGQQLRQALHDIIDDHTFLKYRDTRAPMALLHEDPNNPRNLIQIYTQKSVPKDNGRAWNREHLWPRSRGNTDKGGPDDSDLHHLFPSDYGVNADRASLLFDITSPPQLSTPWSMDADSFQPPAAVVGDIARALFYMAVRYDGSDRQTSNLTLVSKEFNGAEMGHLRTLLQWHRADPPDAFERRRNDLIFERFQHNRNPFVDFPKLAFSIWDADAEAADFSSLQKNASLDTPCEKSSSSPSSPSSPAVPNGPSKAEPPPPKPSGRSPNLPTNPRKSPPLSPPKS